MVNLKTLFELDGVEFIAGRAFLLFGHEYTLGEPMDRDVVVGASNRESLLRSARVIPVASDLNDIPRAFQREVKDRELTYRKLGIADPSDNDTGYRTIDEVKADLTENPTIEDWAEALLSEVKGKARKTFIPWIKAGPESGEFSAEALQLFVLDEDNYASEATLSEFSYPQDPESAYPA